MSLKSVKNDLVTLTDSESHWPYGCPEAHLLIVLYNQPPIRVSRETKFTRVNRVYNERIPDSSSCFG